MGCVSGGALTETEATEPVDDFRKPLNEIDSLFLREEPFTVADELAEI